MPVQAKGQVRPEKSAYHSIALLTESFEKNISFIFSFLLIKQLQIKNGTRIITLIYT